MISGDRKAYLIAVEKYRENVIKEKKDNVKNIKSRVEKPFTTLSRGLDFGKPKKIKKSFKSEGLRF